MDPDFSPQDLLDAISAVPPARRYLVALSGGPDSKALLFAASTLRDRLAPAALHAVHVNHGLAPQCGAWQAHCAALCDSLAVPLECVSVHVSVGEAGGLEAAARRARYRALAGIMVPGDMVLCAHTRDDQAETVVLQMLRGAGVHGLAAMPGCTRLGPGLLVRPLLHVSRTALRAYGDTLRWPPIDDPANLDQRFERGFIRAEIMQRLLSRWPAVCVTLSRVAANQSDALRLLDELAAEDVAAAHGACRGTLSCAALGAMHPARRRNTLRGWIRGHGLRVPSAAQLEQAERTLLGCRPDRSPVMHWAEGEIRRYRDDLFAMQPLPARSAAQVLNWTAPQPLRLAHGTLSASLTAGAGMAARYLEQPLECRFRSGGERCRPAGRDHSQTLKKLFQAYGVAPWLRNRVPLLYVDGRLAAVPGLWVCAAFEAKAGEAGWSLCWRDDLLGALEPLREEV